MHIHTEHEVITPVMTSFTALKPVKSGLELSWCLAGCGKYGVEGKLVQRLKKLKLLRRPKYSSSTVVMLDWPIVNVIE